MASLLDRTPTIVNNKIAIDIKFATKLSPISAELLMTVFTMCYYYYVFIMATLVGNISAVIYSN